MTGKSSPLNTDHRLTIKRIVICLILLQALTNGYRSLAQVHPIDSARRSADSIRLKLSKAREALTKINAAGKKIYGAKQVRNDLNEVKKHISPIKKELLASKKSISNKTLTGYNLLLKRSQDKLGAYRKSLAQSGDDLQKSSQQLLKIKQDSLLAVSKTDSATKPDYAAQLNYVKSKLQQTDNYVTKNLDSVNRLLSDVSAAYLEIADMQTEVNDRLKTSNKSAFDKESSYLWSAPKEITKENIALNVSSTYEGQNKIISDFMDTTWDDRMLAILLGGLFFLWVFVNYRKAIKPDVSKVIGDVTFGHISPIPVTGSIIIMLILSPLCEADAPALYIEVIHFLLMIALTVFFWRRLSQSELRYWLFMVFLFLVIDVTNAAVHESLVLRVWFIVLNLSSLYFGLVFSRKILKTEVAEKLIRPVLIIYLALNLLAVPLNIFGRITLAKTFTITAIIGITQVIGLAVFIQLLTDAFELQVKISACSGGLFSRVDINKMRASFKRIFSVLAVILWLLVFSINLNISKPVFGFITDLLDNKRSFGSLNFTIGNVLFFALILYISNLFQKNVGVLFGEKSITFNNQVEHKSSKLTLFRLIIAIIGVLLAVTASGIPLDKLTVVLGALSVGIGLGMQNIVNNFVSGIILIFEKPFQIGDFVELADKKGKIQDIGIRASKMLTQQGSEVIIPNGDLISNRFTNWTINSAYVQSEILFKVSIASDINAVNKIIDEEITNLPDTVKNTHPEILINSIGADAVELRILIWISSIYVESNFKSQLFGNLITRFNAARIKLV